MCEVCKTEHRSLDVIALDIRHHWLPNVNYAAEPYLRAMRCLSCPQEMYGMETGRSIVLYFLANAATFRGSDARRIKAELKALLK